MSACPDGWTSAATGCYRVTDEYASHWGCVELCGPEASLACITSDEENTIVNSVARNASAFISWTGHHQSGYPRGGGPTASGWEDCPSGEATTHVSWKPGEPFMNSMNCAALMPIMGNNNGWVAWSCASRYKCVCERVDGLVGPSSEYVAFTAAQQEKLTMWVCIQVLVLIPLLLLLPLMIMRCCRCCNNKTSTDARADANSSSGDE